MQAEKVTGEFTRVIALAALFAAHVQRIAHQDQPDIVLDGQAAQHFDIVAPPLAFQRFQTLRGEPEFVAESQADSLLPEIERQNSPHSGHDSIVLTQAVMPAAGVLVS